MEHLSNITSNKILPKKGNDNIATRKIKLFIDVAKSDKEELIKQFRKLYDWQKVVFKASNQITTNLFIQDHVKELFYFQDDIILKLTNREKMN